MVWWTPDGDKVIIVCGERKGGTGYFALDVTDPSSPQVSLENQPV